MNRIATITLASALAVALVGCGPKEEPLKVTGGKTPEAIFIDEMRAKAQGDISKLSPDERTKLDQITRGNSEIVIQSNKM